MAAQDFSAGRGFVLIDPHGDLVDRLYTDIARVGTRDVIYLNATDPSQPYGYNPLHAVRYEHIPLAASGLLEVFKKMWSDAWGVRMEHILRNALYALLEQEDATLGASTPRAVAVHEVNPRRAIVPIFAMPLRDLRSLSGVASIYEQRSISV